MSITMADVAARAGVSKTTVSRVLNGKDDLDPETAARVRQVIEELGYVPSARAVSLARGRTRVVGMLVPSLTWAWVGEVLQGVVDVVEAEGYGLLLFSCTQGENSIRRFASQVSAKAFDGLVAIEPAGTLEYLTELHAGGLPVVLVDDRENRPQFPSVAPANRSGGAQAARHLLDLGRRRPLVVMGPRELGCSQERLIGFADTYRDAGITIDESRVVDGDFTFEGGRDSVARVLAAGLGFDCVFAHNDLSAAGTLRAIHDAGLRIPDDVAVVGFDDVPLATYTEPTLTTVHQPLREMGERAARLLMAHFDGTSLSGAPEVLPTALVVRGSTRI
ncbi:LacI family DNA-binding transcriptional regulator [Rugosimonospora africana]|uniref:LacI family transcriptional regulator n=1 Tax=Rugosimonospora africana TaxID=556532 RepID=A0A8J3VS32_9ACTN|nr:LacI family DNA-binding transcriptional regulator [Rugosimonospora africana]GIH16674.1 LacI family transcriptional regulator [Rugosimonospora africana]